MSKRRMLTEIVIVGVGEVLVGHLVTWLFGVVVEHEIVRDIGMLVIWVVVLVIGGALLAIRWMKTGGRNQEAPIATIDQRSPAESSSSPDAIPSERSRLPAVLRIGRSGGVSGLTYRNNTVTGGADHIASEGKIRDAEMAGNRTNAARSQPHRRSLSYRIRGLDLTHLGDSEGFIVFKIGVRNHSGLRIEIEGFRGSIRMNGAEFSQGCSLYAGAPRSLIADPEPEREVQIKQPVTRDTALMLAQPGTGILRRFDAYVPFDLSSLSLLGSFGNDGNALLPSGMFFFDCKGGLKGPILTDEDAATLVVAEPTLFSQNVYEYPSMRRKPEVNSR